MKKTSIYTYYAFGFNYGLIKEEGLANRELEEALSLLTDFFKTLTLLELKVTAKVAAGLMEIAEQLQPTPGELISDKVSQAILAEVEKIDPALDAELQLREAYILTEKRYSTEKLVNFPEKLLAKNVYESLARSAKKDFSLACRLIALNQPTGAAFHLMRTLEEQVKLLYFTFKKTKRLTRPMWGPMITQLRNKNNPKPSEKTLNHLDGMRVHFRNPTQHPDVFYNLDESEDLLNQTISAINMIYSELPSFQASKLAR